MGTLRLAIFVALMGACGHGDTFHVPPPTDHGEHTSAELASDDDFVPTYGKPELERALIAERGREAKAEKAVADLEATGADVGSSDPMRTAVADLAVRRRFIVALEACQSRDRNCPPRLDEPAWSYDYDSADPPPLDAPLRFDLASWQKVAAELHGRACACRTIACVDGVGVAIDELEKKPMADVAGDEAASLSVTRARQCLFRLRGKS